MALHGTLAERSSDPIATAALAGAIRGTLSVPVNTVNARLLAEQRGIEIVESRSKNARSGFSSCVDVTVHANNCHVVTGTLFAEGEGRIVMIDGIRLEAVPDGHMLLMSNRDMPGVIGRIGTVLGTAGVNISRMQLGLEGGRKDALTVVNVDVPVSKDTLNLLYAIEQLVSVNYVSL